MSYCWGHQLGPVYWAVVLAAIIPSAGSLQRKDSGDSFNVAIESSNIPASFSSSSIISHDSSHHNENGHNVSSSNCADIPMQSVSSTATPLRHCQFLSQREELDDRFVFEGKRVPILDCSFLINETETMCYLTRSDMENYLKSKAKLFVVTFDFACLNPDGTDVVFLEDEEAEELENGRSSISDSTDNSVANEGIEAIGNVTSGESESSGAKRVLNGPPPYYDNVITYFQTTWCRINLKGPQMLSKMSQLRVLIAHGHRAWDLTRLPCDPQLCQAFQNVMVLRIFDDLSMMNHIHHLAVCKQHLDQVADVCLKNNNMTSFPDVFRKTMPNLRSLEISFNNLTEPVSFPWPPGFVRLKPENLSRASPFNFNYNFHKAIDTELYLLNRKFIMEHNNIRNITHFQFTSDFQHISLQWNKLSDISGDIFDLVPNIQFISLAYNELESLPERLFSRLLRLRRLDLQNNKLRSLHVGLFAKLTKLKTLNLEDNLIERLEPGVFASLESLKELKLKSNRLTEFPKGVLSTLFVKLQTVELRHNPLRRFPAILLLMRGLQYADLDYTNITQLDFVDMFHSGEITLVHLVEAVKNPTTAPRDDYTTYNKVISLSHSSLSSIRWYNASRESVRTFSLVLKHFIIKTDGTNLACDCHILNVTHGLRDLRSQGYLSGKEDCFFWRCNSPSELEGIPLVALRDEETYCTLSEAKTVLKGPASGRRNVSLPCPQNCTCYLRSKIETVFVNCTNAGLTELPAKVPRKTVELLLQNNSIATLKNMDYLKRLTSLKLTANRIQELPKEVLLSMTNLRDLHLDDNLLTTLPPDFVSLQRLKDVRLSGNPFRCDCRLLWMKNWAIQQKKIVKDLGKIKCSVKHSEGHCLLSVRDSDFVCLVAASLSELAVPIATPLALAVVFLSLALMTFLHRRRLKVLLYIHTGLHPFDRDPSDVAALYDATVVCDETAQPWVLRHVVEKLEQEGGCRVFFYDRDALVGQPTSDTIRHCIRHSRRLVLVLVKGWRDNHLLLTTARQSLARCRTDMIGFLTILIHRGTAKDVVDSHSIEKRNPQNNLCGKGDGKTSSSANSMDEDLKQMIKRGRFVASKDKHMVKKLMYEMPHFRKPPSTRNGKDKIVLYRAQEKANRMHSLLKSYGSTESGASLLPGLFRDIEIMEMIEERTYTEKVNSTCILITDNRQNPLENAHLRYHDTEFNLTTNGEKVACQPQYQLSVQLQQSAKHRWVFVWYAAPDLAFTLKSVVEPLERRGHSCVLQDRDFAVGAAIQENILEAAEKCSRCVLVLSNHLARDDWFTFVFHVVIERQQQQQQQQEDRDAHRVALVTREDLNVALLVEEVRQVIRTTAVLDEHDPWFDDRLVQFVTLDGYQTG